MAEYTVLQVDAFTRTPLAGNPCAILPQAAGLDATTMQAVAREMNLSETSFVLESAVADFRCRYFTPAEEVPLAGHPTIATVHALCELGRIPADRESVTIELPAGVIGVEIERRPDGLSLYVMTQLAPVFGRRLNRTEAAAVLRAPESAVRADVPVQVVSTGTPQLMVRWRRGRRWSRHGRIRCGWGSCARRRGSSRCTRSRWTRGMRRSWRGAGTGRRWGRGCSRIR